MKHPLPPILGDKSRVTSDHTHFFGLRGQFIDTANLPTEFPLAFEFLSAYCTWKNPYISLPLGIYSHLKFKNKLNIIWYAWNIFYFDIYVDTKFSSSQPSYAISYLLS